MSTVSRGLPARPHLDVPKREARALLDRWHAAQPDALERIHARHPKFRQTEITKIAAMGAEKFRLSDAQLVIAREYGFASWTELKQRIEANGPAWILEKAIRADDRAAVVRLLGENPTLLHLPVWSPNWGPPMSHAANLGRLEIIQAVAQLGARDFQHAFDRALLQGKIECARWLLAHGAKLAPGIVMGACETLNPEGLRFLDEAGAAFTNEHGDPHAPLALVLETYSRNPAGKHAVLEIFSRRGAVFPDTPIMAFHRGDVARLREHLRRDSGLVTRRLSLREIYPPEAGCRDGGRFGMHGTPLDGTTLLHLAIDFDEQEIFDLLLAHGAEVDARATVDETGFGGHTPLFNAVVNSAVACGRQRDAGMARSLLARGATGRLRTNVRKFLDWRETPGWHEAPNVTPVEWGRGFPEKSWANAAALRLLEEA